MEEEAARGLNSFSPPSHTDPSLLFSLPPFPSLAPFRPPQAAKQAICELVLKEVVPEAYATYFPLDGKDGREGGREGGRAGKRGRRGPGHKVGGWKGGRGERVHEVERKGPEGKG
jgi:hypothetical protein